MKTRKSYPFAAIAAVLALSLAVAFATVACDNGSGNSNTSDNPGGTNTFPSPKGKITVNGLSSFEGKYIMGQGSAKNNTVILVGYTVSNLFTDPTLNLTKITNGKAEIPVYYIDNAGAYKAYEGNDSVYDFILTIYDTAELKASALTPDSVLDRYDITEERFSNGNLTINWNGEGGDDNAGGNSTALPPAKGKLTITGLSSFDGKYIYGSGLTANEIPLFLRVDMTGPENDPTFKLAKISEGKAEVPLYYVEDTGTIGVYKAYEGNDQVRMLNMYIVEVAEMKEGDIANVLTNNLGTKRVVDEGTFNGGNLTIDWGD